MISYIESFLSVDLLVFAIAVAIFIVLLGVFTLFAYVMIKQVGHISGMPYAIHLKDARPGQVLIAQSRSKGRDVKIIETILDRNGLGGGFVTTSDRESLRIPSSALVLIC